MTGAKILAFKTPPGMRLPIGYFIRGKIAEIINKKVRRKGKGRERRKGKGKQTKADECIFGPIISRSTGIKEKGKNSGKSELCFLFLFLSLFFFYSFSFTLDS